MAKKPSKRRAPDAEVGRAAHYKPRSGPARASKSRVFYTPELGERICERLAAGERWHSMAGLPRMPSHSALYKWSKLHPEFGDAVRLAKMAGADTRADTVLDVAEAATTETVQVDRLHIGALKWHVERDTKRFVDEPDRGAECRVVVEVRQFERVVGEDGRAFVRELLPNGETVDL